MLFTVPEKVSFACNESPIRVFNTSGRIVFYRPNEGRKMIVFNLPPGMVVNTSNRLERVSRKKQYTPSFEQLFKFYPKQNRYTLPTKGEIKIIVGKNRNKATIYPLKHQILVDESLFTTLPLPSVKFILFHEIGHYFYNDEELADLFASVCMLKAGFNYYDCLMTQLGVFGRSAENVKRVLFIYKKLMSYENR